VNRWIRKRRCGDRSNPETDVGAELPRSSTQLGEERDQGEQEGDADHEKKCLHMRKQGRYLD
jgi:hypothetical protein